MIQRRARPVPRGASLTRWLTAVLWLLALTALACGSHGGRSERRPAPSATDAASDARPPASTEAADQSRFPISDARLVRLIIPRLGIDQEPVEGKVDAGTNTMVAPAGPTDIAYYTYSAHPGKGNAVFSGHVDYANFGPAVFWNLRKLNEGDAIIVRLQDGLELRYAVESNETHSATAGPWEELFAANAAPDALTLYTCDGEFDTRAGNYSERRAVRAVRVE